MYTFYLHKHYLPFLSVGTELTDVQPGQGSQASAMHKEMNFDYPYS